MLGRNENVGVQTSTLPHLSLQVSGAVLMDQRTTRNNCTIKFDNKCRITRSGIGLTQLSSRKALGDGDTSWPLVLLDLVSFFQREALCNCLK